MATRRDVLSAVTAAAAGAVAGCLGGGDDGDEQDDQRAGLGDSTDGTDDTNGTDDEDGWVYEGDPADVPGEEQAKGIVDAYLLAVTQGDPGAFTTVVHPDSPLAGAFTDEDIEEAGRYLNYRYRNMTVAELDRQAGRAIVEYELAIETSDRQETTDATQELRVHDGRWRIWLTAPPEGTGQESD